MSLSRSSIHIKSFSTDFVINIENNSLNYSNIYTEVKKRLKTFFSNKIIKKTWEIFYEISPILEGEFSSPSKFIPYLLLVLDCANQMGFKITESQIRYFATDNVKNFICGSFAVEEGGKSVSRIETYVNGTVTIEKYRYKDLLDDDRWNKEGEFVSKEGIVLIVN